MLWRRDRLPTPVFLGFPCGSAGKESTCNAGDLDLIPGLGRSPREGKGYPLQYSGLENSMDCIVHGVTKSCTRLSNFHFTSLSFSELLLFPWALRVWCQHLAYIPSSAWLRPFSPKSWRTVDCVKRWHVSHNTAEGPLGRTQGRSAWGSQRIAAEFEWSMLNE